jgi:hypothetical protein
LVFEVVEALEVEVEVEVMGLSLPAMVPPRPVV